MYKLFIYTGLFLIYSFIGWIMEIIVTLIEKGKLVNRGFMIGPVVPIYGIGGLLLTFLLNSFKDKILVLFILSVLICGTLEYLISYFMEKVFKARWWDYSDEILNINGRVCLKNLIGFGILGVIMVSFVNPVLINMLEEIDPLLLKVVISVLSITFVIDLFISTIIIYSIKKIGKKVKKDSTEEIGTKVKEILKNKSLLHKRITNAFPSLRFK